MRKIESLFRLQIALPQDHGSWVFILSPLVIGLFAGKEISASSLTLITAAMAAFLIRQPVTIAIKAYSNRRPRSDLPSARFWMVIYGILILFSVSELIYLGQIYILYLGVPAVPVFAWHLWLVSKRDERRQAGVEILATGVLALAAPAAFWIGNGYYHPIGWLLWVLTWFQSAASIIYAYMRLEQRLWKFAPSLETRFKAGTRALLYTFFNLFFSFSLGAINFIPRYVWLAFLLQALETTWGTFHPAVGVKPFSVGLRQLMVTILFTILFVVMWR